MMRIRAKMRTRQPFLLPLEVDEENANVRGYVRPTGEGGGGCENDDEGEGEGEPALPSPTGDR
jgi:hypothetical protein